MADAAQRAAERIAPMPDFWSWSGLKKKGTPRDQLRRDYELLRHKKQDPIAAIIREEYEKEENDG